MDRWRKSVRKIGKVEQGNRGKCEQERNMANCRLFIIFINFRFLFDLYFIKKKIQDKHFRLWNRVFLSFLCSCYFILFLSVSVSVSFTLCMYRGIEMMRTQQIQQHQQRQHRQHQQHQQQKGHLNQKDLRTSMYTFNSFVYSKRTHFRLLVWDYTYKRQWNRPNSHKIRPKPRRATFVQRLHKLAG